MCFQKGPPPPLLLSTFLQKGYKGSHAFRVFSGHETSSVPSTVHTGLLAFTPDPVTPCSGFQQQQKQEIRETDRLEGITVALFIFGCAHSWHNLLAVLQANLSAVYFAVCVFSLSLYIDLAVTKSTELTEHHKRHIWPACTFHLTTLRLINTHDCLWLTSLAEASVDMCSAHFCHFTRVSL